MPKKTFTPEQIVGKLRQIEVLVSQGGLTDDLYQSDSRVARKGGARQWRVFEALPWPDY